VKNKPGLRNVRRLLLIQLGITVFVAVITFMLAGYTAACSAILGGLVSTLPNAFFARKLFQYHGAQAARQIVNGFYKGEAMKIALSVAMFALVFRFFVIIPLVFFAVYIGIQMVIWFAPLIFANQGSRR